MKEEAGNDIRVQAVITVKQIELTKRVKACGEVNLYNPTSAVMGLQADVGSIN